MLRIGLTGGIGSGKSTAAERFQELGAPVIDADVIAHALVEPSAPAFDQVVAAFGDDIVQADGTLNRSLLRQIVFADANKRKRLEAILHPRVRKTMRAEMADLNVPYCILVIPLLIESRQHDMVDRILVVDAPDPRRIAWIKQRSGLSENQIQEIFRAQASREKRLEAADDVLVNDRDVAHLLDQVDEMHRKYCRLAGAGK